MAMDIRTALRQIRRAPATAFAAIVTLAVGIGATTAVFSFVTAVLSAAAPAPDMDRLVAIWAHNRAEAETKGLVSAADYVEWSRRTQSFEAIAAWRGASFNVSGAGAAAREAAQVVTPAYFDVFRWQPAMGRTFTPDDAQPGAAKVVIVSDAYWRNRLGERADVIGATLYLDRVPATIVGVLPHLAAVTTFFVPLVVDDRGDRAARDLFVFARLGDGASLEAARAEMENLGAALEREWPASHRGWTINVRPLQEEFVGPQARLVFALLVLVVSTVLIIGCVNIANLLLARGLARRGELAVRLALGAGSWRVTRQLLVECAVLAAFGGLLSLFVSRWTLRILISLGGVDSPWLADGGTNVRVLLLTVAVTLVATIVAGLAPALAAHRAHLIEGMRDTARSSVSGTRAVTRLLVAAQVTLAVALLVIAGLGTRTLLALQNLEPGFTIDNVLTATVTLPETTRRESVAQWVDAALLQIRRLPGVVSAGATSRLPFAGSRWNPNRGLVIEGQASVSDRESRWAVDYAVTPGLLEALGVPLRAGRTFTAGDGAGAPLVAIVSETMARRFWGDRSPIGARLRQGDEQAGEWRTVVGIVGDIRNDDADQPPVPYLYMPIAQQPVRSVTFAIRTASEPAAMAEPMRRAVAATDPDQALYDVRTMRAVWEQDLQGSRVLVQVMAVLSIIALGLAGLGIWGVVAHTVGQRTREIGVRLALGATAGDVGIMIVRQGLRPLAVGLVAGLAAGLSIARLMRSILFQVTPTDPMTVITTMALLLVVGVVATIGPALRAARLDPVQALRND
jgi:putative ABC transport system permease protein